MPKLGEPGGDRPRKTEWRRLAVLTACLAAPPHGGCAAPADADISADPARNATYVIDGRPIGLVDGVSDLELAPGSASRLITRSLGEPHHTDLNADGRSDSVLLLAQSGGGSGTFYYLAAAVQNPDGTEGSEGFLLGDRIEPRALRVDEAGTVEVQLAARAPGDPLAAPPTQVRTLQLKLHPAGRRFLLIGNWQEALP